jgi:hypothetical protein
MANVIKNDHLRPISEDFDPTLSQFPSKEIKIFVDNAPNGFCGLVGVKSTGKSSELRSFGSAKENKNVVFCQVTGQESSNLDDILYQCITKVHFHFALVFGSVPFRWLTISSAHSSKCLSPGLERDKCSCDDDYRHLFRKGLNNLNKFILCRIDH